MKGYQKWRANQRGYMNCFRVIALSPLILLSSIHCTAAPRVVTVTEVVEVPVDRYVPVDKALTAKGIIVRLPSREEYEAMSGKGGLIYLRWMALSNEENLIQCYKQLDQIATLPH